MRFRNDVNWKGSWWGSVVEDRLAEFGEEREAALQREREEREAARQKEREEREAARRKAAEEYQRALQERELRAQQKQTVNKIKRRISHLNFDIKDYIEFNYGVSQLVELSVKEPKWKDLQEAQDDVFKFLKLLQDQDDQKVYSPTNCPSDEVVEELVESLEESQFTLEIRAKGGKLPKDVMLYLTLIDDRASEDLPIGTQFIKDVKGNVNGWSVPFTYGSDKPQFYIRLEKGKDDKKDHLTRRGHNIIQRSSRENIPQVRIDGSFKWRNSGMNEILEGKIFAYPKSSPCYNIGVVVERYGGRNKFIDRIELKAQWKSGYYLVCASIPACKEARVLKIVEVIKDGVSIPFSSGIMGEKLRKGL